MRIRRIRFTLLLLALGFSLLTSAPALSMKPIVEQQIVPDADGDELAVGVGAGGQHGQKPTGEAPEQKPGSESVPFDFQLAMSNLRELFKSAWLTWMTGILP